MIYHGSFVCPGSELWDACSIIGDVEKTRTTAKIKMCQIPWRYSMVCVGGGGYKMFNLHCTMDLHLNQLLYPLSLQINSHQTLDGPPKFKLIIKRTYCNPLVNSKAAVSDVRVCLRFFIFIACFYIQNTKHISIQSHHIFTSIQRHLMIQIRPHPLSPL